MSLRPSNPAALTVAASLAAVQGGLLVVFSALELANLSSARITMGLTTTVFFLAYGAGLSGAAWALTRRHGWARGPIVLTQLIELGVAWSFRGGQTTPIAVALAVVSLVVLAGMLHPATIEALSDRPVE